MKITAFGALLCVGIGTLAILPGQASAAGPSTLVASLRSAVPPPNSSPSAFTTADNIAAPRIGAPDLEQSYLRSGVPAVLSSQSGDSQAVREFAEEDFWPKSDPELDAESNLDRLWDDFAQIRMQRRAWLQERMQWAIPRPYLR